MKQDDGRASRPKPEPDKPEPEPETVKPELTQKRAGDLDPHTDPAAPVVSLYGGQ